MFDTAQMDCDSCPVRNLHCDTCMVTAFLALESPEMPLDAIERGAVSVFASAGLISTQEAAAAIARTEPADGAVWASVG